MPVIDQFLSELSKSSLGGTRGNYKYNWSDLRELYLEKRLSTFEIAKLKGCTNPCVSQALKRLGIPSRSSSEALRVAWQEGRINRKERAPKFDIGDLEELYVREKKSAREIAVLKGVSRFAVVFRLRKLGIPRRSRSEASKLGQPRGAKSPSWRGGRIQTSDGYILVYAPSHPYADKKGYLFEHRFVMERQLGRYLLPWEIVHHKNRVKNDNRGENLELFPNQYEHIPGILWERELKKRDERIQQLEKRVTLLEAENVLLRKDYVSS